MTANPAIVDAVNRIFTQVQTIITKRMSQAGIHQSSINAAHLRGTPPSTVIKSVTSAPSAVFGASGAGHSQGVVPDPGAVAGTTHFLREDATWAVPSGGGSGVDLILRDEFNPTAAGTMVSLSQAPGTVLAILRNGLDQRVTTDWTISGQVVTFTTALTSTENVIAIYTASNASSNYVRDEFTGASGQHALPANGTTTVTLTSAPVTVVGVFRNGLDQRFNADWTVSGSVLTVTSAFNGTDNLVVVYTTLAGTAVVAAPAINGLVPLTTPPAVSTWTWFNQGVATADNNQGILTLAKAGANGDSISGLSRPAPATPYSVVAAISAMYFQVNFPQWGIGWYDGTKLALAWFQPSATAGPLDLNAAQWNSVTSFFGNYISQNISTLVAASEVVWIKIADDGTNRSISLSADGNHWTLYHSVLRTDFLTPTKVVFAINPNLLTSSTATVYGHLWSWAGA